MIHSKMSWIHIERPARGNDEIGKACPVSHNLALDQVPRRSHTRLSFAKSCETGNLAIPT